MLTVFDSATIAPRERLDAWREITAASMAPTAIDVPDPEAFTARLRAMPLGNAQVATLAYTALTARRSMREIRRSDPEYYEVGLIRAGRQGIEQNDTSALVPRGNLVLWDSSVPYEAIVNGTSLAESALLQFPKRMLPLPVRQVTGLCAVSLPGTEDIGSLLAAFLASLADDRTRCTERDTLRLETIAVDLTTAVLAHHLERENPPLRSPTHTLYLRIIAFIEENLHHPELRPATIAAAHRISPRHLHRIFQQHHPAGVAAHIRTRRLDRARRDLADHRLDHLTIATIARRWGFSRPRLQPRLPTPRRHPTPRLPQPRLDPDFAHGCGGECLGAGPARHQAQRAQIGQVEERGVGDDRAPVAAHPGDRRLPRHRDQVVRHVEVVRRRRPGR
ncbi:AraC family transcriptional regulator [Actinoplanes lobatus]|uniref:AraC family transcriptional regulator n=1 Tax=Actinoplanes lobatus TaxID=113568 RepID=A0A7W7HL69_9ACTN|nr:helix-turn-helix domain-containing protein [Actinoplanes lobatus]MBB4752586.1 AraC-like DNA-binding protein [Actinoplanes lobatus]GGN98005.1 AraC family transcriptional regulator [Actinoplanes lobatus]GIE45862.1 AraC family transcriptional regulator [Actinoplanes lobatus]